MMEEFLFHFRRRGQKLVDFFKGPQHPPVTVDSLLQQLDSWWPFRAGRAARALRSFRDSDIVSALIRALRQSPPWGSVQKPAIDSLAEIGGTEAWAALAEVLCGEGPRKWKFLPWLRIHAAKALGRRGGGEAVFPLCQALEKDSEGAVRAAAAAALGQLWMRDAVNPLIAVRRDVQELSRRFTARPDLAEAPGIQRLLEVMPPALDELRNSPHYAAETQVLDQVGQTLCQAVEKGWQNPAAEPAIVALSHLGDARAVAPLARALNRPSDNPNRKQTVRSALRRIVQCLALAPDPADLQALLQAAGISDQAVQQAAVEGLCNLVTEFLRWPPEEATPPLIQLLQAPRPDVRLRAIQALGEVGDARALSALQAEMHLFSNVTAPELKAAAGEAIAAIEARVGAFTNREISRATPSSEPIPTDRSLTRAPSESESMEEIPERLTEPLPKEETKTAQKTRGGNG